MKCRYPLWWVSLSSSFALLALFLGSKLTALGEVIASELEHSYGGNWPANHLRGSLSSAERAVSTVNLKDLGTGKKE
jgi:hypothetical protein